MFYKMGDRIKIYDKVLEELLRPIYIIALVDVGEACLISLNDGNRWRPPIPIKNPCRITKEEMNRMLGSTPEDYRIEKVS